MVCHLRHTRTEKALMMAMVTVDQTMMQIITIMIPAQDHRLYSDLPKLTISQRRTPKDHLGGENERIEMLLK